MGWIPVRPYECDECGRVEFFQTVPKQDWECEACVDDEPSAAEAGKVP